MKGFRYLANVTTLEFRADACTGCGMCVTVCPHGVFKMNGHKAMVIDYDACMECGACARNCPVQAITVQSGVGCASGIMKGMLRGTAPECGCDKGSSCC